MNCFVRWGDGVYFLLILSSHPSVKFWFLLQILLNNLAGVSNKHCLLTFLVLLYVCLFLFCVCVHVCMREHNSLRFYNPHKENGRICFPTGCKCIHSYR